MDCIVPGVAKSQTRLTDFHFHMRVFIFEYTSLSHKRTSQAGEVDHSGTGTKGNFLSWSSGQGLLLEINQESRNLDPSSPRRKNWPGIGPGIGLEGLWKLEHRKYFWS